MRKQRRAESGAQPAVDVAGRAQRDQVPAREGSQPAAHATVLDSAWTFAAHLIHPYFHLALDMQDLGMSPHHHLQTALATLHRDPLPWQISRHAETFAVKASLLKPTMQLLIVEATFAHTAQWLTESGYQPDLQRWFAGAQAYAIPMVPDDLRADTTELLDYERLQEKHASAQSDLRLLALQNADGGKQAGLAALRKPAFDLREPRGTVWFAAAGMADPIAAHHAALALVTWIFNEPGAVVNGPDKALAIAENLHLLE